ncbi:MAG: putative XRE-type DNA-binding protein [Candidatus Latescibacterota bacterium]|jgi:predicted XRE-type DNA-binding protein
MGEDFKVEKSSGNIFSDLGFDDEEAKEELLKAQLGAEIFHILKYRKLTQTKAAEILGVKQPEISRLKSGKFSYYSVERLMRFLERLNCEVSIHIARPANEGVEKVIAIS